MRKEFESGHITRHCESVRTKQSDEIASHSFAKTEESERSTTSTCHPCESGDLMRLLTTLVPCGTACWRRLWLPVKRGMTEGGRTLVEMLSTLAIMGILTVAGVAAYNSAMNRYRANTLINEAQKRAVVVVGQIGFNNQKPSLTEFEPYNKTSAGEFGNVITEGLYKQFGIQVSGVTKSVCQNILRTIGATTPIRRLSLESTPRTPLTSCEESNDFLFIYNNDMQGATSDTEYAIDDSSCKSVCGVFNPETHTCDESDCEIPTNACTENADCNQENECMICDTETNMCKNGCERVQFLKSTGTQYVDTGIYGTEDLETELVCQQLQRNTSSEGKGIFGAFNSTNANSYYLYQQGNLISHWQVGFGPYLNTSTEIDLNKHTFKFSNYKVYMDGTEIASLNTGSMNTTPFTLLLFNTHNSTGGIYLAFPQRFYRAKFIKSDVLIGDFIPVLSPESSQYAGQPCMFDRVSQKLFCNSGTGEFKTNLDE